MKLATRYLDLDLKNPLVAGAGPLTGELDNIRKLEAAGAGAIVLPSIFEEEIKLEHQAIREIIGPDRGHGNRSLHYFPAQTADALNPERYLSLIERAVNAVDIPIIASLNGASDRGWVEYAQQIEAAGAHAVELNIYFVASDLGLTGNEVEQRHVDILKAVRAAVSLPVAVKIGPYFSAMGEMARRLDSAGADGLVMFNRFYEPDIDLVRLNFMDSLELSHPYEMRLPLLWTGALAGRVQASIAASTGVDTADEVIKYLLAGADVVMTTSALLRHGIDHMKTLVAGLERWLDERDTESVSDMRGLMSHLEIGDPLAFNRAGYFRTLCSFSAEQE